MLTPEQTRIFSSFLEDYDNRLSNDGCNDMVLPNTEENRRMICDAQLWNCRGETEEYCDIITHFKKLYEEKDIFGNPTHPEIVENNGLIFGYLRHLAGFSAIKP